MDKFKSYFTKFYINILLVLMAIVIYYCFIYLERVDKADIVPGIILIFVIALELFIVNKNLDLRWKLLSILFLGFVLRGLWLLNVNSMPTSDFRVIYECAQNLLTGDTAAFWGSGYIARFPHLTIMVIYMAVMIKIFPVNNLIIMKIFNLAFGIITIYLIYLLAKEIFNSKKLGLYAASLASVFPPLVTYVGVYCTENIAIPLYLLSTYIFILVVKNKKSKYYLILSGAILSVGNLFRMVATIMVIAFGMYLIIYTKDKIFEKVRKVGLYLIPYLVVLFTVSFALQWIEVTEFHLWKGSEPKVTSILKGSNIESGGRWNEEDASIVDEYEYDYDMIEEASKKIIIERLTTTHPLKLAKFYLDKFAMQWNEGDFGGVFWSELDVPEDEIIFDVSLELLQVIYILVMILVFLGIINRRKNHKDLEINLIYLILCGYGVMYLVTESQGRYSLIIAWVFIILATEGIRFLFRKSNREEIFEKI
ncbi:glycosyltransferase family 39 protein [Clostridium nigeriense]|uniref:glycosyltransferase family 39 protein n=1 Tax=Clostridium nigeriense TaxID=1805470 RepID=UPI003D34B68F